MLQSISGPPPLKKKKFRQNTTDVEICILLLCAKAILIKYITSKYIFYDPAKCQSLLIFRKAMLSMNLHGVKKVQIIFIIARLLNVRELIHQCLYKS